MGDDQRHGGGDDRAHVLTDATNPWSELFDPALHLPVNQTDDQAGSLLLDGREPRAHLFHRAAGPEERDQDQQSRGKKQALGDG